MFKKVNGKIVFILTLRVDNTEIFDTGRIQDLRCSYLNRLCVSAIANIGRNASTDWLKQKKPKLSISNAK